jgi:cytochrome c-type biogenesis protein CcsB
VAILLRWVASGHGPYLLKYEVLSSNAWVAVALLTLFVWRRPRWAVLALVVLPVAILALAFAVFSSPHIRELPPTLRSVWLVFHIAFAKLSAASFLMSVASAVALLLKRRVRPPQWVEKAPPVEALDAYIARFVGFGWVFWTVTIAAGAVWANQSWGRYWGWDAVETWSLVTWLVYGTFLHVKLLFKLKPAATASWALGCFALFVLVIAVLPFVMPSLHSAYFQ